VTLWPGAQRFALMVSGMVCAALIVAHAPAASVAGIACVLGEGAWLPLSGAMVASLSTDIVALIRHAKGRDAALMDVTFEADGGPAETAGVSRRTSWLVLQP